jgi:hypothetical protein
MASSRALIVASVLLGCVAGACSCRATAAVLMRSAVSHSEQQIDRYTAQDEHSALLLLLPCQDTRT